MNHRSETLVHGLLQHMGSSNGTYINKYPLLPIFLYKLKPDISVSLGVLDMMKFVFKIS